MKVLERIVVVGNSTAGITVANKLRTRIAKDDAEVILIAGGNRHYFNDASVFLPINYLQSSYLSAPVKSLLKKSIVHINENIKSIDIENSGVLTEEGHLIRYTYLVLAMDCVPDPDAIPGFKEEARSVDEVQSTISLREDIQNLKQGSIVIGNAPNFKGNQILASDLAILLSKYFREKKLDSKIKIQVFFPEQKIHGSTELFNWVETELKANNIEMIGGFSLASLNVKNRELVSSEGKTIKYDLPVVMPPESLHKSILSSNIPKAENGQIDIDENTLSIKNQEQIYLIGGSLGIPGSQNIYSSLDQAEFVSARIANKISGYMDPGQFKMKIELHPITDDKLAISATVDGDSLLLGKASETDFLLRLYAHSSYFGREIRGFV
ncbi:MAG: Pyruvate dehydrogenase E3 / dihydrolipoamide dehydrogenase [Thermoplasmatales archaeon E-plasma]|nr:MAG: Pyruvate dehydrogenase E3 / dihydrolipoamide dehydrogenase [Thermoplasmatales archaeon E-plasma]